MSLRSFKSLVYLRKFGRPYLITDNAWDRNTLLCYQVWQSKDGYIRCCRRRKDSSLKHEERCDKKNVENPWEPTVA